MHSMRMMGFGIAALSGLVYYKRNTLQNPAQMKVLGIGGMAVGSIIIVATAMMDREPEYY